jgi:sec-independent protein translocase protein TatA
METLAFFTGGTPGIGEIGIILAILLLLFGAKKLPQLSRSLGASLTEFKRGKKEGANDSKETTKES